MKQKIIYSLSAIILALVISVSGIGNCYIKAEASSGVLDPFWNTEASAWSNIGQYLQVFAAAAGIYAAPSTQTAIWGAGAAASFLNFMLSDGYSEEVANEVVHGGGGFVRDGVTRDSDGNVTFSDEVSDLFYNYICNYLVTDSGYTVATYMSYDDFPVEWFESVELRNNTVNFLKSKSYSAVVFLLSGSATTTSSISIKSLASASDLVLYNSTFFSPHSSLLCIADSNSVFKGAYDVGYTDSYQTNLVSNLRKGSSIAKLGTIGSTPASFLLYKALPGSYDIQVVASKTGGLCKIWNSNNDYINRGTKDTNYYYSSSWLDYDSYSDNSMTISNTEYQYYTDNSSTVYNNVQNIVNNSGSDLTEDDIQRIVEDELKKFKDNMNEEENEDDNGGDNSGGGGSVSGNGTGGTGIGDFVGGLGSLLDFILSLLGKVIGLISDFLNSALELLGNLTSFTDGFSSFLTAAFAFLPEEAVTLICSGIALLITLGIIKYMRN